MEGHNPRVLLKKTVGLTPGMVWIELVLWKRCINIVYSLEVYLEERKRNKQGICLSHTIGKKIKKMLDPTDSAVECSIRTTNYFF